MSVIAVRATINLPGLRHGEAAVADPEEPYIAECLTAGWLVRDEDLEPPTEPRPIVNRNDAA